ncbi:MAG: helix-turn-helix transcriptional regulator [bacterium]|nr:helix-turn-helix transcriptional regulator [bacterium]
MSRREHQICCLAFSGLGNVHIADVLGISEGTVKNLRKRLYFKMDVTCERELFALFLAHLRAGHKTQIWPTVFP